MSSYKRENLSRCLIRSFTRPVKFTDSSRPFFYWRKHVLFINRTSWHILVYCIVFYSYFINYSSTSCSFVPGGINKLFQSESDLKSVKLSELDRVKTNMNNTARGDLIH